MVETLIVIGIVLVLVGAFWFSRGAKAGPYAGDSTLLDEKARQLDDAFRERPPQDY
jgi:hypothetical protein